MTTIRHIRKGLAIYKTGRSPYWLIRLRDPYEGKDITRSSKETSRVEAADAANEYAESFFRKANGDLAMKKTSSFEHYANLMLAAQKGRAKAHDSDRKLLYRQKDGIIRHFGDHDISKITTRMIRDFLTQLDQTRGKPLAESTRAKYVIVIRKVLALAVEDGLMKTIPVMPRQKTVDTPRHAFSDDEYKRFMKAGAECVDRKDEVRGVHVTGHHLLMFTITGEEAAALTGLAPAAHDSRTLSGKQAIAGGRRALRHVMFQVALVAAHHITTQA